MISLIIPSYNEQDNIFRTYETIEEILNQAKIDFEIIFVDDGSVDNTYVNIARLAQTKANVRGLSFSRNFGKESAIFAGLESAAGECAVIMDCDLQHPPTLLPQMYELWQNGYEVVEAVKSNRGKESVFHRMCANGFYGIISRLTKIDMKNASDFKLLDRIPCRCWISLWMSGREPCLTGMVNMICPFLFQIWEDTVSMRTVREALWQLHCGLLEPRFHHLRCLVCRSLSLTCISVRKV